MNLDSVSRKTGRQITHGIETAEVHPKDEFGQGTGVGPSQMFDSTPDTSDTSSDGRQILNRRDRGHCWMFSTGRGSLGHQFLKIALYTSPMVNLKPCLYASSHLLVLSTHPCFVVPGGMSSQTGLPGELITMSP